MGHMLRCRMCPGGAQEERKELTRLRKVLGSRIYLDAFDTDIAYDFHECVRDIIDTEIVQRLAYCPQHVNVNRLEHSLGVAYYSFIISRRLGLDSRSAARGGLLHDLFFYDRTQVSLPGPHCSVHPRQALENAEELCRLTALERDIIANHMWPMHGFPRSQESLLVSFVDKMCAAFEFTAYLWTTVWKGVRNGSLRLARAFS